MGISCSATPSGAASITPHKISPSASFYYSLVDTETFHLLGISDPDIDQYVACFAKVDTTGGGLLDPIQLLTALHLPPNHITRRIAEALTPNGHTTLNFKDFVIHTWYFLTMTVSSYVDCNILYKHVTVIATSFYQSLLHHYFITTSSHDLY